MIATRRILLSLLFCCFFLLVAGQSGWKHIEGMPCEETYSITQDSEGFMWFGTRLGLIRYDGYRQLMLRNDMEHPRAFSSCDIRSLKADKHGKVFAGSFFGLNTLDCRTFHPETTHFNPNDFISCIHSSSNGDVWIGTGQGLYVKRNGKPVQHIASLTMYPINGLEETADHSILTITDGLGVCIIHPQTLGVKIVRDSKDKHPLCAASDQQGNVWIGTDHHGIFLLKNGTLTPVNSPTDCRINTMVYSRTLSNWVIGTDHGIYLGREYRWKHELPQQQVNHLFDDAAGNLWASTSGLGIWFKRMQKQSFLLGGTSFAQHTTPIMAQFVLSNLADTTLLQPHRGINSVFSDGSRHTYIGTQHDGFFVYRNGKLIRHLNRENTPWLRTNDCYAFIPIAKNQTALTSWNGLYIFNPNRFEGRYLSHIGKSDIRNMHTLSGCMIGKHDMWLGLVGGIARVKFGKCFGDGAVLTLYNQVNKKGIYAPKSIDEITDKRILTGDYQLGGVYRIVQDSEGRIWACTSEPGLLRYDEVKDCFISVSASLGIQGDNVHSLDIDSGGNFWMTTNYGILQLRIDNKDKVVYRRLYTPQDGLSTHYYGNTLSSQMADGSVCFINQNQFIQAQATRHNNTYDGLLARITDISINGKQISDSISSALTKRTTRLTLTHRQNNLSVSLSALAYGEEQNVCYAYQLEGVDACYRFTENGENTLYYNQLQPGSYILKYGVADAALQGPEHVQELKLEILQPIWWRWWAKLIYILCAFASGGFIIYSLRERSRKKHQLEILQIEKRNIDEQYEKMTRFYTRVIHEFMTPVTLMSEMTHQLQQRVRPALQASLFMLASQTDKLLEAMNNLRDVKDDATVQTALIKAKEMAQTDRDFLRRCTESVNRHIDDENYTHQVMMDEVGTSHATLYRRLKALTGMDATSFIRSIRMKAACQILSQERNIRIAELAERVGYSNPKYFSTCFKKDFGISPSEYKEA